MDSSRPAKRAKTTEAESVTRCQESSLKELVDLYVLADAYMVPSLQEDIAQKVGSRLAKLKMDEHKAGVIAEFMISVNTNVVQRTSILGTEGDLLRGLMKAYFLEQAKSLLSFTTFSSKVAKCSELVEDLMAGIGDKLE